MTFKICNSAALSRSIEDRRIKLFERKSSERAQEAKQPSEDSRIVVEDKCCVTDARHVVCGQNYLIWDSERRLCGKVKIKEATTLLYLDFLLRFGQVRTRPNGFYPYFEPRTGRRVWFLPPPELLTGLGSRSSRKFRFEPEFGTGLRQH